MNTPYIRNLAARAVDIAAARAQTDSPFEIALCEFRGNCPIQPQIVPEDNARVVEAFASE